MTTNTVNNPTTSNTSGKQAGLPLILLIPVVVGAAAGTGAAVGGASTATALGIGIAGGVVSGLIVWGASRELDRNMRSGDLARDLNSAMSTSQKQKFVQTIQEINAQINKINDLEALGNYSVGRILRKDLAKSYTKLTGLIDNVLPNVRTGSAVKEFSESLKTSRASILSGNDMNVIQEMQLSSLNKSTQIATSVTSNKPSNLKSEGKNTSKNYQQVGEETATSTDDNVSNSLTSQNFSSQEAKDKTDVSKAIAAIKENADGIKQQYGLDVTTSEGLGKAVMIYWKENNLDPKTLKEQLPNMKGSDVDAALASVTETKTVETTKTKQVEAQRQ
jgi:hypothetical protein